MINNKKIFALIPARLNSKGLKNKNIMELHGKPLIYYPLDAAKKSKYIDYITVSTDSSNIAELCFNRGVSTPFIRPASLAKDDTPSSDVILHALEELKEKLTDYEYLVLLEPTSPLTNSLDIDTALEKLEKESNNYDSLISVSKVEATHPQFCLSIDN